jgi:lipoprotein-releasing system permease protein
LVTIFAAVKIPLLFARRYLFAKRSTNAINIITGISVGGIAIGTAALILVLSVFNGFEDLLGGLFGYFNPDVKITATKGKTFEADSLTLANIAKVPGIATTSLTLEEIAFFEYAGAQDFGTLKGVDAHFARVNNIDSTLREGVYSLQTDDRNEIVVGAGLRNKLNIQVENGIEALNIYMPMKEQGVLEKPFKARSAYPVGTFAIQQDFDYQYMLTNIGFVRELLDAGDSTVSAIELRCAPGTDNLRLKQAVAAALGSDFTVKTRQEQNDAFFRVMQLEKWMGFAITSLMLLLMAFNMIGALWMIVLDKQKDISMLKSMGATDRTVRAIFLTEGMMLTFLGMLIGFAAAILLYWAQKTFGLISIPQGFLVNSYPIAMRWTDFAPVTLTVLFIGFLASIAPALRAMRVPAYLREE